MCYRSALVGKLTIYETTYSCRDPSPWWPEARCTVSTAARSLGRGMIPDASGKWFMVSVCILQICNGSLLESRAWSVPVLKDL